MGSTFKVNEPLLGLAGIDIKPKEVGSSSTRGKILKPTRSFT